MPVSWILVFCLGFAIVPLVCKSGTELTNLKQSGTKKHIRMWEVDIRMCSYVVFGCFCSRYSVGVRPVYFRNT